ncbi:uridine nucleosidase Urh1 [Coccidioides immitis RS]|uniref:Uridine nucleosidase Urh1 n=3 Tax=Coccidioides immitis TaxID=5501 RepID=J3KCE2_COCIM|nr:uridine nucleosidase Urh1 [Coccidioides immitis RS]EAS32896.3 uridine nucleosidase Urh1 [Coccidioides immitis RS]KMP08170.1 uridine nucleosidase [Coccidioides immitis RMSCC 2394]KMU89876.1 uridine nucleosidase [Coccidioides immitis H538.4]
MTLEIPQEPQPVPLWLDCDPGHDDAFAILLAAHHPQLKLLGITTVHGNASLENTTANAGSILEAIGRSDIPVYPGSKKPFCRLPVHAPSIHGSSGIDGTDLLPVPKVPPVTDVNPILAMRNALLAQPKDTAWVVATGALTNVGLLFATFPEVAEHVRGVSIMGGAIGSGFTDVPISKKPGEATRIGNTTPYSEFNIYTDPEAAKSILMSPILAPKTTLITLDLTHQVLATQEIQSLILATETSDNSEPSVLRQILHALLTFFASSYDTVFGIDSGPPLHDPVAVAVLLSNLNDSQMAGRKDILQFNDNDGERYIVDVVTNGSHGKDVQLTGEVGRTVAQKTADSLGGVTIPVSMDVNKFWGIILDCLQRAEKCKAMQLAANC